MIRLFVVDGSGISANKRIINNMYGMRMCKMDTEIFGIYQRIYSLYD